MKHQEVFQTIRSAGGLITTELLQRIAAGDASLEGLKPEDYHLSGLKLGEATSRAWYALQAAWGRYREAREKLEPTDLGTGVARDRWLLPMFSELGFGRLPQARELEIEGKKYPISHMWGACPIHLVGHGIGLDERTQGAAGAARQSPHSLVQEYLNRSAGHLWGFVSNGLVLRLLRDNASLTRVAFIEFDLEAMMEQEAYADFVLIWLLCHESRVAGERPELCWLEKWSHTAQQEGSRALDSLRRGVEEAIRKLGEGFLAHPRNAALHEKLASGELKAQDYYHQLLRTIYRMLFLLVAEARGLLCPPGTTDEAAERYQRWYSITRLRDLSEKRRGGKHPDLWQGLRLVFDLLGTTGKPELGIPALGSYLWSKGAVPDLEAAEIASSYLLAAVRALTQVRVDKRLSRVDFRNLGAEELGSIYEALLELHPDFTPGFGGFKLETASGNERKTTGSYYTPTSLINELLDSALVPVMDKAVNDGKRAGGANGAVKALLDLKVCDPACGSGHFLIAAAHRMAKKLAAIRTGEEEPTPDPYRKALRDVISHCIYGVDLNPMAVELCKVSMWLEALEPGKPLSFLDHHIKIGNSLLGTTPELIAQGIPDGAFKPLTEDDRAVCTKFSKRNRQERTTEQRSFLTTGPAPIAHMELESPTDYELSEEDLQEVQRREARYQQFLRSNAYLRQQLVADAWCAAFMWHKTERGLPPITTQTLRQIEQNPLALPEEMAKERERLYRTYAFFHWFLEFPEVFGKSDPEDRGFDVVLGNPPWEHEELKEKEWFASRRPDIAEARTGNIRKRLIDKLEQDDPALFGEYARELRSIDATRQFLGESGRFPLCGRGRINTYAVFAELNRSLISSRGRAGCIVPSGIATDDTTKEFFQSLTDTGSLVSLFDFENRKKLFPDVDSRMKFCLLTMAGAEARSKEGAQFVFFAHDVAELKDLERRFALSAEDNALLNPNTRTCPIFRSARDAELTKAIYKRVPVLIKEARDGQQEENPWGISFKQGLFNMTSDSHLFRTREQLEAEGWKLRGNVFERSEERFLPLYEAKMIHHFDHRWATYDSSMKRPSRSAKADEFGENGAETSSGPATRDVALQEKMDPGFEPLPRYWVSEAEVEAKLEGRWPHRWLMGWRDITNTTNERTAIFSIFPQAGVGHTCPLFMTERSESLFCLVTDLDSLVSDYITRQKVGGTHLTYHYLNQIPVIPPESYRHSCSWCTGSSLQEWIKSRVLELTYTSLSMKPFAEDLGCDGPHFSWDDERRFQLRCELDAAFFHLYGCSRDDAAYILDTFPILCDKDIKKYGTYRTKDSILSIYDAMQLAIDTGEPYQTILDPPPADSRVAHQEATVENVESID
ncbi:MAG TPA: N-6 DNA methylase [Candidatus Fermentibacter daniensis]|nr:MAG: N-6 DNA Methylase [Deltaproteobacteria bacterium ADurb.Bin072]HPH40500.1 N-6 DNA methylase [Candidatus Fermentibacter daniensis]